MSRRAGLPVAVASLALAALILAPADASAAPPQFWQAQVGQTTPGARGIAVAPDSAPNKGHVFVNDQTGRRIVEFTAWGEFVKTWGFDVVATGPGNHVDNPEVQSVAVKATSGTFTLTFGNPPQTSAPLAWNASAAQVESALNALSTIGGAGGAVSVGGGPGDATGSSPYTITFEDALGGFNVGAITVDASELGIAAGTQLTCTGGPTGGTGATTVAYQWLSAGAPASGTGATTPTYTVDASDAGKVLQCRVTATHTAGSAQTGSVQVSNPRLAASGFPATSPPLAPGSIPTPPAPTGGFLAGKLLECEPGAWTAATAPFAFQWYRNGVALAGNGANTAQYTLQAADVASAAAFQCAVTGSNAGGAVTKVSSNRVTAAPAPAPSPAAPNAGATVASPTTATTTADGVPVFEICRPAEGDVCKAGIAGTGGAGQFDTAAGIAVDSEGNVYAAEAGPPRRVQKFSPAGEFLLSFGGGVNQGGGSPENPGNVCTKEHIENGDTCGAGETGTGPGEFSGSTGSLRTVIAIAPDDKVWVGDKERIQRFNAAGEYQGQLNTPGEQAQQVAVDEDGFLYASYESKANDAKPNVHKLDPTTGEALETFEAANPRAIAVAANGDVYVFDKDALGKGIARIRHFDAAATEVEPPFGEGLDATSTGLAVSSACDIEGVDVFHSNANPSFVRAYGPPPDPGIPGCEQPEVPPEITAQYATSVGTTSATVQAQINPHFWPGATYYVQYGTTDCAEGPCEQVLFPGAPLTSEVTQDPVAASAALTGLAPDTTYHFRFVTQSGGGGPVFGADRTFTTYRTPEPDTECPNQAFRAGPAANLPDCRAYEMVSPVDKNGGEAGVGEYEGLDAAGQSSGHDQSAPGGGKLAYSAAAAFAGAAGAAPHQYLAGRDEAGWSSESIDPPLEGEPLGGSPAPDSRFRAFSSDLCQGWLVPETGQPLSSPGPSEGFANLYRRDNCAPTPAYAWLESSAAEPEPCASGCEGPYLFPELQGVSADGSCAAFRVNDALTPEAPQGVAGEAGFAAFQLYLRCEGKGLRLASVLPNGTPFAGNSSAGTESPAGPLAGRGGHLDTVEHALSDDGSRLYWTTSSAESPKLHLRFNANQPQSAISGGKCSEAAKACTLQVSPGGFENLNEAQFWTASPDGTRAIFSIVDGLGEVKGDLYEYAYTPAEGKGKATKIAGQTLGVAGSSEDATRVYFASEEVCSGATPNSEGDVAEAGEANLYLYEAGESCAAGQLAFLGTLAAEDVSTGGESGTPSPLASVPRDHIARAGADGSHLAFVSAASLTGYDNADAASGQPDREVYLYDAGTGQLTCASCNPAGARPSGADLSNGKAPLWAAAWIPGYQHQLYGSRPLSASGDRLFFNSLDSLSPGDSNGAQDVYEWEAAGSGHCTLASPSYSAQNEGCVDLISSGQSPEDSEFADADADGSDVFVRTGESLLAKDPGAVDVYDARVEGGFAADVEAEEFELTVKKTGAGTGEVTSSPAGIECGATCTAEYEAGTEVTLSAVAGEGSTFSGWSGAGCSGTGTCEVTMDEATEVSAQFDSTVPTQQLTVATEGGGSGTVTSSPGLISCSPFCTEDFEEGAEVTLTATPAPGSVFYSWKRCDSGGVNGRQCTVAMDKAKTVTAVFATTHALQVSKAPGSGLGKVQSSPGGILCLANCSETTASFLEGTKVTLKPTPSKYFAFAEWSGDCTGNGACEVTMGEEHEVGALFTAVPKHLLTLTKTGGGAGTVKASVAGINCGATCSSQAAAYYQGAVVELTATPGKGSAFGGWSGAGCSGTGTCTVTMSAAKEVTAEFE